MRYTLIVDKEIFHFSTRYLGKLAFLYAAKVKKHNGTNVHIALFDDTQATYYIDKNGNKQTIVPMLLQY